MGNTLKKVSLNTFRGTRAYQAYCDKGLRGFTDLINGMIDQDDIEDHREIQAILFFASERFGVPMQHLADQTGYARQSFSHYRSGTAVPSPVMRRRILNLLLQPLAEQLPPLPEGL
jgi:hypothetical protein